MSDRYLSKVFDETNETLRVSDIASGAGSLLRGVAFDDTQLTEHSSTDEWKYFLSGILKATIEITYEDSTKQKVIRARRI